MAEARIIDGKAVALQLRKKIAAAVADLKRDHGLTPGLAVVLVGDDPASAVYVRTKTKRVEAAGMASSDHRLPASTSQDELLALIASLNANPDVHGILVQLPLPGHIDERPILEAIDPAKDVDGFHPVNAGRLMTGADGLFPCTPVGCVMLAKSAMGELSGAHAVIIGRSNIVGKPLAQLLLRENCTVTQCHSRTRDLPSIARQADLLVAAIGRPEIVKADWIKPGACVIDVGINRVEDSEGNSVLVGDVDFAAAREIAGSITPVPGGVGPMTIACVLRNTVQAACAMAGVDAPDLSI